MSFLRLKVLACAVGALLISVALARLFNTALKQATPPQVWQTETTGLGVALAAWHRAQRAHLHPAPLALVVGSSVSMDVKLPGALETFNLGFYAASPPLIDWVTRQLAHSPPRQARVVALEFLPHFHTAKSRDSLDEETALRKAAFLEWAPWRWLLDESPRDLQTIVLTRLRGTSTPEITTNLVNRRLSSPPAPRPSPYWMQQDVQRQDDSYDLRGLTPDAASLQLFIGSVQRLAQLTSCLVVFVPPQNAATWRRGPQGEENLAAMLEQIRRRSGHVVHLLPTTYPATFFRDATHLSRPVGQRQFTQDLTSLIARQCPASLK